MIIGDRSRLAFELQPVEPSWERRGVSDRGPWARLAFWVRERNLTTALDETDDRVVHSVAVPLVPIASWLVESIRAIAFEESPAVPGPDVDLYTALATWNRAQAPTGGSEEAWEDGRYGWYRRHFWLAGSEGSLLPDVGLVRSDGALWVSWRRAEFPGPRRLRFTESPGVERVEWRPAWEALRSFVDYVASEVRNRGLEEIPWAADHSPLDRAIRCSPAEYLELAAPAARPLLRSLGIGESEDPEDWPSLQALRDLSVTPQSHQVVLATGRLLDEERGAPETASRLVGLRAGARMALNAVTPEEAGYDAARWLRRELGLDGAPLPTVRLRDVLRSVADLREEEADTPQNHAAVGKRRSGSATVVLLLHARTRKPWAQRMELSRAIGHLLLDPETDHGVVGAGSSVNARGPRRRRSGTFAAELLLPASALDPASRFEDLMSCYGVGAQTAAYQLWNHGFLVSEEERDWLIAEHGWRAENAGVGISAP